MFQRRLLIPALVAAVGVPYAMRNEDTGNETDAHAVGSLDPSAALLDISGNLAKPGSRSAETAGLPLERLFRFDISPQWITTHWSRVSTIITQTELQGLRVPVVTGTETHALAGVVTYYFDARDRLVRIAFQGSTGDERPLLQVVLRAFELRAEPKLGAGVYVRKWRGRPFSVLRIRRAPIIRASAPNASLEISMELNRPRLSRQLSPAFASQL